MDFEPLLTGKKKFLSIAKLLGPHLWLLSTCTDGARGIASCERSAWEIFEGCYFAWLVLSSGGAGMLFKFQSAVSLFTCSCLLTAAAPISPSIGFVMTAGDIQVDGSSIHGNSILFPGSVVKSFDASSSLQYTDGTIATLRPSSTIKVYSEHAILERGIAVQRGGEKHAVIADGLKISGTTQNAVVLVGIKDSLHLEVSAQTGMAEVRTAGGDLVARVESGKTLSFALGAAGQDASMAQLEGILRQDQSGHYLLTDSRTNVTYELKGPGLEQLIGSSVSLTGTVTNETAFAGASRVIQVSQIHPANATTGVGGTSAGQGATPAANRLWTGGSIIFAIIVAAGGVLLGLAAAGELSSGPSPATPTAPWSIKERFWTSPGGPRGS
jgi:hypothetical protein